MGEIAEVVGGGTPRTERTEYYGGDIAWITPADLSGYRDKLIGRGARSISKDGLENSGARLMPAGTVLFSSRAPIGYVAIAANPVATNQGFKSFVLRDGVTSDYVYYYLQHAKKLAVELASGTTFLEISGKKAAQIPIPIPPVDEQREIVAEIEKQFTRLEVGVAGLWRVQANLKRYRAAVLKAACEGKLVPTEAELARQEGRSYETGAQLLERILTERRQKSNGKEKYKEPAKPDTTNLPELPRGWAYTKLDALLSSERVGMKTGPFGTLLKKSDQRVDGVPVLGIENIESMKFLPGSKVHITHEKRQALKGYSVQPDDILISRSGTVGEVCVVPLGMGPAIISTNLLRISLHSCCMLPMFFCVLFNGSPIVLGQVQELCKGSTRNFLNQHILNSLIFPLPPLAEQRSILAEVERRLSVIEEMEAAVNANLKRASRLSQSILGQAFSGKL